LRLRAIGIFFMCLYFSFIGFLRGIKNTRVPMMLFVLGALFFMFFDWVLIKGTCGFVPCGLQGSAYAYVIQYVVMCIGAVIYMLANKDIRLYSMNAFKSYSTKAAGEILKLSWPVMLDKATLALAKIWILAMIAPIGENAISSFSAIHDLIQLAFVPGLAFGQVITLLVSNETGAGNWAGVKQDIKKVLILAFAFVGMILLLFSLNSHNLISIFDTKGAFTSFAAYALPIIAALAFFDLLQLVFSASLRGAGDVKTVMVVRILSCLFFLCPLSWLFSVIPIEHSFIKFILVYGTYYLADGLMSYIYVRRLSGKEWHLKIIK
jgi:multidrug resistance protein, MATE family